MSEYIIPAIKAYEDEMIAIRHHLHRHPELSLEEHDTSKLVAGYLASWGYQVSEGIAKTGVVGTLTKGTPGKAIGLRADMDALPIHEATGLAWASENAGKMHACGHDGHTTILLAAARYIASEACQFNGTVQLIFQPAEEAIGGADIMIQEGLFDRFPCDAVFALHNMPGLPAGKLGFHTGNFMASADTVNITLRGYGGHGAQPDKTVDPIAASAALIMGLQTIVSRNVPPGETAIISVGTIHAGIASNVIPDSAEMELTVRAMKPDIRALLLSRIKTLTELTAQSYGAHSEITVYDSYPVLINHPRETEFARQVALETFGKNSLLDHVPTSTGSEDFAFMLEKRPGSYFLLGNGEKGQKGSCMIHNPGYDFNDGIISTGASFFVRLVERFCQ